MILRLPIEIEYKEKAQRAGAAFRTAPLEPVVGR
jgi:hypothetical protein